MKRFLTLALAGVLVLGVGSVAYANICAFDPVPAATVLFPFVAYNYTLGADSDDTLNTLFAITNVSSAAQIVHVTLWTDYSVAVVDWNVLLTGYDVYTFNVRDILKYGNIPATFNVAHNADGDNTGCPGGYCEGVLDQGPISNRQEGFVPDWGSDNAGLAEPEDTTGLNCIATDVAYPGRFADPDGQIPEFVRSHFQQLLQGSQNANNGFINCGDSPANPANYYPLSPPSWWDLRDTTHNTWAYVTADVVNVCNKAFPDTQGYWDPNIVENDNVLIADVQWINEEANTSEVANAVHIEADSRLGDVATFGPNGWVTSFYAKYSNFFGETDDREPLGTAWGFRYQNAQVGDSEARTYIRAFKTHTRDAVDPSDPNLIPDLQATLDPDTSIASILAARTCVAYTYYTWDEEENVDFIVTEFPPWSGGPGEDRDVRPNLLPLETQEVNADTFNLVDDFGWMLFVWPASNGANEDGDSGNELFYQTWMGVKYTKVEPAGVTGPGFSGAKDGALMANYNCFSDQILPALGINFRYIDRGGNYKRSSKTAE
jgi:hypothetical protein